MQRWGFSLIDHKMSKKRGSELIRILDICTAQKDFAFIVTLWGHICKGNGVRKTDVLRKMLWERRCEKDVVRKTLWERRCEKDVVEQSLWKIYLFWPASFNRQIFVIKNVLHRLGVYLWCLCLYSRRRCWKVKLHNQAGFGRYLPRGGFKVFSRFTLIKS